MMESLNFVPFFCGVLPCDPWQSLDYEAHPLWLCYQIGNDSRLYRCSPQNAIHGGILCAHDRFLHGYGDVSLLCRQILRECRTVHAEGFCANWSRPPSAFTRTLVSRLEQALAVEGLSLWVTEPYAGFCQSASVLMSTALSQQTLSANLDRLLHQYGASRMILTFERTAEDFTLPSSQLHGTHLTSEMLDRLIRCYSPTIHHADELLLNYFTYEAQNRTHMVLFDTEQTFWEKRSLANQHQLGGFLSIYQETREFLSKTDDSPCPFASNYKL